VRSVDETLNVLQDELHSVESQLSEPDVASDLARLRDLSRRHKELLEINNAWIELKAAQSDFSTAKEMFNETSGDDRELWREEMNNAEEKIPELEVNLETLLLPHDPNEGRNVILEIRGAEGGEEANLFAGDLAQMYRRYAALRGWKLDVIEERESEQGGVDEAIYLIKGEDAWFRLQHEAGVHRVQRVPVTEAKGRVHTSSATCRCCPRPKRSTSTSTRATSRSTSTDHRVPADRASTRLTRPFASRTCRPASSCRCRTRRVRSRTAPKP